MKDLVTIKEAMEVYIDEDGCLYNFYRIKKVAEALHTLRKIDRYHFTALPQIQVIFHQMSYTSEEEIEAIVKDKSKRRRTHKN